MLPTLAQLIVLRTCERTARTATEICSMAERSLGCGMSLQTIVTTAKRLTEAGRLDTTTVETDGRPRPLYSLTADGKAVVRASLEALLAAPTADAEGE